MKTEYWLWSACYLMSPLVLVAAVRTVNIRKHGISEFPFKGESVPFLLGCGALLLLLWPLIIPAILLDERFRIADRIAAISRSPWQCGREHLLGSVTVAEAEASAKVVDPLYRVPDLPFGHLNTAWLAFLSKKKIGYRLHGFAITTMAEAANKAQVAMRGYAWVRLRSVKAEFICEWGG